MKPRYTTREATPYECSKLAVPDSPGDWHAVIDNEFYPEDRPRSEQERYENVFAFCCTAERAAHTADALNAFRGFLD